MAGADRKQVTIIGAGFIGLASALWLQEKGHQVTLIDRAPPLPDEAWEQAASFGNACTFAPHGVVPVSTPGLAWQVPGMLLNPAGPLAISWRYMPHLTIWLMAFLRAGRAPEVQRIAKVLASLLDHAGGGWDPLLRTASADHLRRHNGCLYLYKTQAEFEAAEYGNRLRERHGVSLTRLDESQVQELEPNVAPVYHRGVLFNDAYTIDRPRDLAAALAKAILAKGGCFIKGNAADIRLNDRWVQFSVNGTDRQADHLVIASGAWSASLARQIGDRVLLDTERGYHVLFPEAGKLVNRPVCFAEHGFYMTPMADGLRAAGTIEFGGLSAAPNSTRTDVIAKGVERLLPGAGPATRTWMGFRPSMPDSLPVIGHSPRSPNVTYAFGHGHLGLTLGGVTGRLVAELVSGERPHVDLDQLKSDRFGLWGQRLNHPSLAGDRLV